ncbi:MAG TPA: ABC transporter substrate-binding protein [Candidatus Acidoferrales bacterium]|nr:ABC transporter substrate-binding protein [Candidatus Acidoferrales bacterium]
MPIRILLLRPEEDSYSALDQSLGARLAGTCGRFSDVELEEETFPSRDLAAMETCLRTRRGKLAGVVGATSVPQSTLLGEMAEDMKILCFVANNNLSVWQGRRHVFHIGLPTVQTSEAVAELLAHGGFARVFLLHDDTEFQRRVAETARTAVERRKIRVGCGSGADAAWPEKAVSLNPDLVYLIYSDEKKASLLARTCRSELPKALFLFGRSLLRETFIEGLGAAAEGALFVDLFRRGKSAEAQAGLVTALFSEGVKIATANHGFGWDAMTLCALALFRAGGNAAAAVSYLERGETIDGATGSFRFGRENHNGREGFGPTRISRWYRGRLEEAYDAQGYRADPALCS